MGCRLTQLGSQQMCLWWSRYSSRLAQPLSRGSSARPLLAELSPERVRGHAWTPWSCDCLAASLPKWGIEEAWKRCRVCSENLVRISLCFGFPFETWRCELILHLHLSLALFRMRAQVSHFQKFETSFRTDLVRNDCHFFSWCSKQNFFVAYKLSDFALLFWWNSMAQVLERVIFSSRPIFWQSVPLVYMHILTYLEKLTF